MTENGDELEGEEMTEEDVVPPESDDEADAIINEQKEPSSARDNI